jgi:hypothetical protein
MPDFIQALQAKLCDDFWPTNLQVYLRLKSTGEAVSLAWMSGTTVAVVWTLLVVFLDSDRVFFALKAPRNNFLNSSRFGCGFEFVQLTR